MKLLVNTASTFKGGSIQVAKSFLEECRSQSNHIFHVIVGKSLAGVLDWNSFPVNFSFYPIGYRPATRVFSLRSASTFFDEIERKVQPDAVFTTSGPAYWRPKSPHLVGFNISHCVYPDSPYWATVNTLKRYKWLAKGMVWRSFFKRDGDAYVVQTEDINKRLRKFLDTDKVFTVSNTCSRYYTQPTIVPAKLPPRKEGEFRFLTFCAGSDPHKRLDIIPDVLKWFPDSIKERIRFVLTLPEEDFSGLFQKKISNIINVGPVKIEEGPALYHECDAIFFPTLLECFSATYAEAMATKRPIVTSDLDFARCVCQNAAIYFNPMDPRDIAEKISNLVLSQKLSQFLVEKGTGRLQAFESARSRAEKYIQLCEQLAVGEDLSAGSCQSSG